MNGERDAPPFHRLLLLQPLDHSVKRGGREDAVLASERFIAAGISQDMVIPASNTTGVALPVRQGFTSRAHYLVVLPRHSSNRIRIHHQHGASTPYLSPRPRVPAAPDMSGAIRTGTRRQR